MKKLLMGVAAFALILSSCTRNEMLDAPNAGPNDGKVRFSASTGLNSTKAANGNPFNSTGDLQKLGFFQVEGYSGGDKLVNATADAAVMWTGGTSWEYQDEPYWPNGTMNFIAYANWPNTGTAAAPTVSPDLTIVNDGLSSREMAIGQDAGATAHTDFLVAVTKDATKQVRTLLTFKHALTQIVFKAGNITPDELEVFINSVEIVNVADKGSMNKFSGVAGEKIKWSATTASSLAYNVNGITNGSPLAGNHYQVSSTVTPADYTTYPRIQTSADPFNNALMLIPQTFTAWDPNSGAGATATPAATGKAYIKIGAVIRKPQITHEQKYLYLGTWNAGDPANPDFDYLYIPVESVAGQAGAWEAGKRVNYIITFGEKNSGSGGGGYDNNGDPILVPIRFRAMVEDWIEADVPLLSANFSASSTQIDGPFVNGYTKLLLNDVKAAPAAKVFRASITMSGNITNNTPFVSDILAPADFVVNINTLSTPVLVELNSKFRPGSTLKYDFTSVAPASVTTANELTFEVPTGWKAEYPAGTIVTAQTAVDLNTSNKTVLLTKLPVSGYDYTCSVPYIEDLIGAIEANENGAAVGKTKTEVQALTKKSNAIKVTGAISSANVFSSELLAKLDARFEGWTITIDMDEVTGLAAGNKIETTVPAGWNATFTDKGTLTTKTFNTGDVITVAEAGKLILIKRNSGAGSAWLKIDELNTTITSPTTVAGDQFQFDNVDFDVPVNLNAFSAPTATLNSTEKITVIFRYKLSAAKVTNGLDWIYNETTGIATYTKP